MSKIDDGGTAFPLTGEVLAYQKGEPQFGMTLRDYFAAAALQGLLASGHFTKACDKESNKCYQAYSWEQVTLSKADEDRPEATWYGETKSVVAEYVDDEPKGFWNYDCVVESNKIADAMIAARKETQP